MSIVGAHMSIRGGLEKAFLRGQKAGCAAIQLFTRNTNKWVTRPLSLEAISKFKNAGEITAIMPVAVHSSYLINLASSRHEIRRKSFFGLLEEIQRASVLGIPHLVMHPGAHLGEGENQGLRRVSDALSRINKEAEEAAVDILLETTAGQGTSIGYRFEHLSNIIENTEGGEKLGVCLDTCHIFAAGYDFRSAETYNSMLSDFDRQVGIERIKLLHLNDSKKGLGSRVDRHEHLGLGHIGQKAFSFFVNDPKFEGNPFIIETPKGKDMNGMDWDVRNLKLLRNLAENKIR